MRPSLRHTTSHESLPLTLQHQMRASLGHEPVFGLVLKTQQFQVSRKNNPIGRVSTSTCGVQRALSWRHKESKIHPSWSVRASFASDDGLGSSSTLKSDAGSVGTRLSKVLLKRQSELVGKFNEGRKKLPMKIFLVLLGFYAANALATILGQTGDWDVLVAGIVVAIIELIGSFMYQEKYMNQRRFKGFLIMLNYWKAGFTLGLFVDAFKVGS